MLGVLPHLDRPFEYALTPQTAQAEPGMRVRVRFAGRDADGVMVGRTHTPDTDRPLAPVTRLVSDDVVLAPQMLRMCEDLAAHCGGSVADVLRLALPPRHARAERADRQAEEREAQTSDTADDAEITADHAARTALIQRYTGLSALLTRAGAPEGPVPRAAAMLEPADAWTQLAAAAVAALPADRGALLIAPDQRDVQRLASALTAAGIDHEQLASADGPEKRYRAFRRILRGRSRIVIGNRSAAFAPVQNLSLIICWDEADDLLIEPRAPYPHIRDILQLRSHHERAALLLLAASPSIEVRRLIATGQLVDLPPAPAPRDATRPRITAMDDYLRAREGASGRSRLPRAAHDLLRRALPHGPVLVQVPRSGYVPAIACTFCGTRARCPECAAPLGISGHGGHLLCGVCGRRDDAYECPECHRRTVRALVTGSVRTAEELRRAFPDTPLAIAGGAHGPLDDADVPDHGIVVATPGAEPAPPGRYAAALLLDADAMLARAAFDADVEAVRRWSNAIALVRSAEDGGEVLVVGTATLPAVRHLVAHRSQVFPDRVLDDRRALDLPPFTRVGEIRGDRCAVTTFLQMAAIPDGATMFGPVPTADTEDEQRAVVRIDASRGRELAASLRAAVATRSARKMPGRLRARLDPPDVF